MRNLIALLFVFAILLTGLIAPALAGGVADRSVVTIGAATGSATWTNTALYAAIDLKRITVYRALINTETVTVYRVTSGGAYTNTVGSVVTATKNGTQATLAYNYLKNGDMLLFDGAHNTGAVAIVEYEVQKH